MPAGGTVVVGEGEAVLSPAEEVMVVGCMGGSTGTADVKCSACTGPVGGGGGGGGGGPVVL